MQQPIGTLGATQIVLGTLGSSVFPTLFKTPAGCAGTQIKVVTSGSSGIAYVLPTALPAGATVGGATAIAPVLGYPLPGSIGQTVAEPFPVDGPASFYMAATGSTCTLSVLFYYSSQGVTLA